MKYRYILFDLDGTLTDPKVGITKSVKYALERYEINDVSLDELEPFIGPPLKESFMKFYQLDEQQAIAAIGFYREYFSDKGLFENEVYAGIVDLLSKLKQEGKVAVVATSKPTVYAKQILTHFGLTGYFKLIVGSNLDGTMIDKAEIIAHLLTELGVTEKHEVVMIGDRKHDIIGAQKMGVDSIGVAYGYGSRGELKAAVPTHIVDNVDELQRLLI